MEHGILYGVYVSYAKLAERSDLSATTEYQL